LVSRREMGPKGPPTGVQQPSLQQQIQRQQPQPNQQASRAPAVKPTADDALSNASGDDDVPLVLVDQKYLSDKKFAEFNVSPNSKRCV
jgi:ATP-dependent RNA helicase MSS116